MKPAVMDTAIGGDVFAGAARAGFAGVELSLRRAELRSSAPDRLRSRKDRFQLAVPSLCLGEHSDGGLADADPDVAEAAAQDVRQAIAWAAELAAEVILVPFFSRGELHDDAAFDRAVAAFRSLCPGAAERGVTLCFEGTLPADRIRLLAECVGSPAFACYFDLANPIRYGLDPATEIRALGGLIRQVHVKDTDERRLGLGSVDLVECARALDEIGYRGWLVLETPAAPPPVVARDLSFTRSVFASLAAAAVWPRFGAFSYDFARGESDRLAETFRDLGLEAVQLGGPLLDECLDKPSRASGTGLEVAALAGYRNLIAPDPDVRRAGLDFLSRCLEAAPALGTWVVATETGTRDPDSDWADSPENRSPPSWALLEEAIETLLPVAERHGTVLAIEGSAKHVVGTHDRLGDLLSRFPSPHLQVVCDPYNYLSADLLPAEEQLTQDFFRRFEHHFVLAHLKDVQQDGDDVRTPEFGTGVFHQTPYLEFLRERRPDLPLILEHLPLDHVPQAISRVSRPG